MDKTTPKKVFIKTFGCQMNEYDSDKMSDVMRAAEGYEPTNDPEQADLILFNTCSVREKAQEKVFSDLGRVKHLKAKGVMIGVGGCVASQEGAAIIERAPYVDVVFGPQTLHRLPEMLSKRQVQRRPQVDISFPEIEKFDHLPPARVEGGSAFVSIMEGCSKYCSYCVVPYTRGEEVSRPFDDVLVEVAGLADQGVKEVTLLGQNVNAYRGAVFGEAIGESGGAVFGGAIGEPAGRMQDGKIADFALLLEYVAAIPGIERLRYTTSHPRDMDDELIAAHRDLDTLMPYLHLPVQSGSDRILKAMNRRHTAADYRRLIDRIRSARPDIAMSGDFIVGFPGETEEDFAETLKIVRDIGYAQAFSFKYSPRPGTPGAELDGQVPEEVKDRRLQELQALLISQQHSFAAGLVGSDMTVLLEKQGRHEGQLVGRSPWLQPVIIDDAAGRIGDIIRARITHANANSLSAKAA